MTLSGGNFTTSVAIPNGSAIQFYFTYRRSAGGMESNSSATPHSYTVGNTCSGGAGARMPDPEMIEETSREELELYPNPASSTLTIRNLTSTKSVTMIDATGRQLSIQFIGESTIDISVLPAGFYSIQVIEPKRRVVKRFMKE
jgi:hypothetical protein